MPNSQDDERYKLVPACRRCRARKTRCDRLAPKCTPCTRSNSACIVVDPVTSQQYPRDYIRRLEEREKELRSKVQEAAPVASQGGPQAEIVLAEDASNEATPRSFQSTTSGARQNGFVGDGSGLGFFRHIFSDIKWQAYKPQILQHLMERPEIPELAVQPNAQPPVDEALSLLDNYFTRFHIHHSFLLRQDVLDIFERIYHPRPGENPSAQDHFRLFMVFALSAVTRYRKGLSTEHPYGYFLAAQAYLGLTPLIGSLDAIQNLLLLCRFGMYHHIGTSLWEISRFCTRQCVELRLQAEPRQKTSLLLQQHQRRIFWECYVLDRYSSGVLGRPFAIAEADISVPLPVDASDEAIMGCTGTNSLSDAAIVVEPYPTELSVFIFCIKLRKITSSIHLEFYNGRSAGPSSGEATPIQHTSGHTYVKLYHFLDELDKWLQEAPIFPQPRSLYERLEWYEFLMEKDKLLLVRGAIHKAPRREGRPPPDLLELCLASATRIIVLYDQMMQIKCITWTRSYFQVIFAAGLSIIYCVSIGVGSKTSPGQRANEKQHPFKTLALCSKILESFKKEMPDAGGFSLVFEVLKDKILRESTMPKSGTMNESSQPEHVDSSQDSLQESQIFVHTGSNIPEIPYGPSFLEEPTWSTSLETIEQHTQSQVPASIPLTPMSHIQGHIPGFNPSIDLSGNSELLDWPPLTDEMMGHLEANLGAYAWASAMDLDLAPWDD